MNQKYFPYSSKTRLYQDIFKRRLKTPYLPWHHRPRPCCLLQQIVAGDKSRKFWAPGHLLEEHSLLPGVCVPAR